jgi:hypothetical protein
LPSAGFKAGDSDFLKRYEYGTPLPKPNPRRFLHLLGVVVKPSKGSPGKDLLGKSADDFRGKQSSKINGCRQKTSIAMQKVEGSSPFSRF